MKLFGLHPVPATVTCCPSRRLLDGVTTNDGCGNAAVGANESDARGAVATKVCTSIVTISHVPAAVAQSSGAVDSRSVRRAAIVVAKAPDASDWSTVTPP